MRRCTQTAYGSPTVIAWLPCRIRRCYLRDSRRRRPLRTTTVIALATRLISALRRSNPDSFDILPALLAEKPAKPCRQSLTMQGEPLAVRQGRWKLIPAVSLPKGKTRAAELYDLEADLAEVSNLAEKRPDKV